MAGKRESDSRVNTSKNSENGTEPNAQNSELDPSLHPSGSRIQKLEEDANQSHAKDEPSEGGRDEFNDQSLESPSDESAANAGAREGHRTTPETRADEG